MNYKPLRTNPSDTDVVVRTEVTQPGQAPVQIDYSMEKTPEGWKAYDVVVAGVSLVTNYRDEFNDLVQKSGIDGLIKALADKNKESASQMNRTTRVLKDIACGRRGGLRSVRRREPALRGRRSLAACRRAYGRNGGSVSWRPAAKRRCPRPASWI